MAKTRNPYKNIIATETTILANPPVPKNINNILLLSGGGVSQSFFAMGAVKCLIDNNFFDFDVISGVSGGALFLSFIEACYAFGYTKRKNWYNRYVRKNVYKIVKMNVLQTLIHTGFDFNETVRRLYEVVPNLNKKMRDIVQRPLCEYTYMDAANGMVTNDHNDIVLPRVPYWNILRIMRCALPITSFYNRTTVDAGSVQNLHMQAAITEYDPNIIVIINISQYLVKEKYAQPSLFQAGLNIVSSIMNAANNETMAITTNTTLSKKQTLYCSISNMLNKSEDPVHKDLFSNYVEDSDQKLIFYSGVAFGGPKITDMMRVLENEGYIQMYYAMKNKNMLPPEPKFLIPNKRVYNKKRVRQIYNDFANISLSAQFVDDFSNYQFPPSNK